MHRPTCRRLKTLLIPLCAAITLSAACQEASPPQTEVLVLIRSPIQVDRLWIRIRNIDREERVLERDLHGRDIESDPYRLLIQPSLISTGEFFLHAIGYQGDNDVAARGQLFAFETGRRLELTLDLVQGYVDHDQDGFPACASPGCDCNDRNRLINPFLREECGDFVDNNCSGYPIDEGCPCDDTQEPVLCTSLPSELRQSAGIGACHFGALACVDGTLQTECDSGIPRPEIPGNFVDDDCDGSVDEGSACTPGTSRPCHRGFVDDDSNPDAGARRRASQLAIGECGIEIHDPTTGELRFQPRGMQHCTDGRWESCEGDRLPQREPLGGIGWTELLPNPDATPPDPGQCDGLDNDCDGLFDEEPAFDYDNDQFTICGTCPGSTFLPKLCTESIDCDDQDPEINPGQRERCGNEVDEDCRCDHDPMDRSLDDFRSVIGLPVARLDGTANCSAQDAYLDCSRETRSDDTQVESCASGPTPYFQGFFGPTDSKRECYTCPERLGLVCDPDTTACETREVACAVCDAPEPSSSEGIYGSGRPLCMVADSGCTGTEPPVWVPIENADPNRECPGVSCDGYYWGTDENGRCFQKRDQTADEVLCKGAETCYSAAHLCPNEADHAPQPIEIPTCQQVSGGCAGTTPPVFSNQPNNRDRYGDCTNSYQCDGDPIDSSTATRPYFHGVRDATPNDGRDNPHCFFKANVPDAWCNGSGACQSREQACLSASEGGVVSDPPLCHFVVDAPDSCRGTNAPRYGLVERYADPYRDCSGDATCDGAGACHVQVGGSCSDTQLCELGLTCVDGVCCTEPCAGTCLACSSALTGMPSGTCHPISFQVEDRKPAALCAGAQGCGGQEACVCEPSTGVCLSDDGAACTGNEECASGECECRDAHCSAKVCSAADCDCGFNANGDTHCDGFLNDGVDDGDDTCGPELSCGGSGNCNWPDGAPCGAHIACESNHCECADSNCSARICAGDSCVCGFLSGGACVASLGSEVAPVEDPEDCDGTNTCAVGNCVKKDGQPCNDNSECVTACLGGLCLPRSPTGGACDLRDNDDCANRNCMGTVCGSTGASCNGDTDCVHGNCETQVSLCGAPGAVCGAPDECVHENCYGTTCGGPGADCSDGGNSACQFQNCFDTQCGVPGAACVGDEACVHNNCSPIDSRCGGLGADCGDGGNAACEYDNCSMADAVCGGVGADCSKAPNKSCVGGGTCVDDVCCTTSCDGVCEACTQSLTGVGDGTCSDILFQVEDREPTILCSGSEGCVGGGPCVCLPSGGLCLSDDAGACLSDSDCASGNCECKNSDCSQRACTSTDCDCRYDSDSNGSCDGFLNDRVDDPEDSCGSTLTCNGVGGCNLGDGTLCTADDACESEHCVCLDANCASRTCFEVDCTCGSVDSGACVQSLGSIETPIEDPEHCEGNHACAGGECRIKNGVACASDGDCIGTCINGLCASLSGLGGPCDDDGTHADCSAGVCEGGVCGAPGAACTTDADCLYVNCVDVLGTGICGGIGADCGSGGTAHNAYCLHGNCSETEQICGGEAASCVENGECVETCIGGACAVRGAPGDACDQLPVPESDDCLLDVECVGGVCGAPGASCPLGNSALCQYANCNAADNICGSNGSDCLSTNGNYECTITCIADTCSPLSPNGDPCDDGDDEDCIPGQGLICDNRRNECK